jgi:hypothetical protein
MKSAVDEIDGDLSDDLNHDTKILLDLIKPWWWNTVLHVVSVDSYLSPFQSALMWQSKGFEYTNELPVFVPLSCDGKHYVVVHRVDSTPDIATSV